MSNLLDVGIEMRRLRKEKGWSQQELADKAGYCNDYISAIERGKNLATPATLNNIFNALGYKITFNLEEVS